eukprot:46942_1
MTLHTIFLLLEAVTIFIPSSSIKFGNTNYLQCFGDLTAVYWQWVTNNINYNITHSYNGSNIGSVLWTQSPLDSTTQYVVLQSVYFSDEVVYQHGNLQLDLIHVNSEWTQALKNNFAIWPTNITKQWIDLYPKFILKHSVYKNKILNNNNYTITTETKFMSKPDWIDFPILFYNPKLLSFWGNISSITSWTDLFEAAAAIQEGIRVSGNVNFWGYLFSLYLEDITCALLEFITAFDGGNIIEEDGYISIDNKNAVQALELMGKFFGNITDPNCLTYNEQDILNQFLSGNALFVRGWYSSSLSYMNYYSQGGFVNSGTSIYWNISRLPGYATYGGISLAVNNNVNASKNDTQSYYDFAQHSTSFDSSLFKWKQTQIIPPYKEFLDNTDSSTYCNESYVDGINKTYFGSPINICSMDLRNLTSTYLVSRPSYVNIVGDSYSEVSSIIQKEVTKYLTSRGESGDAAHTLKTIKCRLQYLLYSSDTLESAGCGDEIEIDSALKVLCYSFTTILILICFTLIVLIVIYNNHPAISSTSVTFSILLNVGAIFMSIALITNTVNPYDYQYSCVFKHIFYNLGFALMFGSMFCSYKRVKEIFEASEKCAETHIRDVDVLKYTGIVILGEILCLLFWFMLDSYTNNIHLLNYQMVMVNESDLSYYYQCYLNSLGYLVINIYNTILVCYGMYLAYQTRYIRYIAFRQSYVYSVIASLFFFTVIIVHPVYFYCVSYETGNTPNLAVIIFTLSTLFLILGTITAIFSYKIYLLFKFDADVLRKEFLIPRKNTIDTIHSIIEYSKSTKYKRERGDRGANTSQHTLTRDTNMGITDEQMDQHSLVSSLDYGGNNKYMDGMSGSGFRNRPDTYYSMSAQKAVNSNSGIVPTHNITRSGSGTDSGRLKRDNSRGDSKSREDDVISELVDNENEFIPTKYDIARLRKLGWIIQRPKI